LDDNYMNNMFDKLNILCAHIHQGLLSWIPPYLVEMGEILDSWFSQNPLPEIILPLATCQAANGDPEEPKVLRAAVAILSSHVGLQILDDIRLKNNRQAFWLRVGTERATHYGYAFQTLSDQLWAKMLQAGDVSETVVQNYYQEMMIALAGRNRVLSHQNRSWEAYWKTAEMTSAHPSGQLAASGAMLAMVEDLTIEACRTFGYHLGLARHLLEEYQRMWGPGAHHLTRYRDISLPVLYGLKCNHPDKDELTEIIQQDQLALHEQRVMEILDAIDAKGYLMWAALQERKRALEAIKPCPSEEGKQLLEAFLMGWFEQIPAFARGEEVNLPDEKKVEVPQQEFDPKELSNGLSSLCYRSVGLGLRQQIRQTPFNLPYNHE
jgi:geranylgeranyl diphosphate synthase type I